MRLNDVELTGSLDISGSISLPRHPDTGSATEETGSIYADTTDNSIKYYDGVNWSVINVSSTQAFNFDYVVVAGGGGGSLGLIDGSNGVAAPGGGAGGVLSGSNILLNVGEILSVTLGAGGLGTLFGTGTALDPERDAQNGNNSTIVANVTNIATAIGGGAAGYRFPPGPGNGGSGGTAMSDSSDAGGSGTAGQGSDGAGWVSTSTSRAGGGGGGQNSVGIPPNNLDGKPGAAGFIEQLTGTFEQIAGGGGGGAINGGTPTSNAYGGGIGGITLNGNGGNGTANTGGGGGGGGGGTNTSNGAGTGGTGGSGGAYIAIPTAAFNSSNLSGTVNVTYTLSINGSNTIVKCLQSLTYTN